MKRSIDKLAFGLVSAGSVFAASPGNADFSGAVSATSEYMFRGIETSDGAAVQGSVNYEHDTGFYASVWGSNIDEELGSTEVDFYGGWAGDFGAVGLDLGAIQYTFNETNEDDAIDNTDYLELYGGVTLGGLVGKAYVTDDYFNTDEDGIYATLAYTYAVTESVSLTAQGGYSVGDGVDLFIGDDYVDYSLTLAKSLENGLGASFALIGTNLDESNAPTLFTSDDSPKFVVALSKAFDF